jgi:hypothetical protein
MMALVGAAATIGCMRSSNLRSSAGALPELSPAGELHSDAGETARATTSSMPAPGPGSSGRDPVTAPSGSPLDPRPSFGGSAAVSPHGVPATSPAPMATPAPADPAVASPPPASESGTTGSGPAPDGGSPATPVPPGPRPDSPAKSPTPLLDAEIRRAQTVTRQQFESIDAAATTPAVDPAPGPTARPAPAEGIEPKPADRGMGLGPPLPPLAASAPVEVPSAPAELTATIALPPLMPIDRAGAGSPTAAPPQPTGSEESPSPSPGPAVAVAASEDIRRSAAPKRDELDEAQEPAVDGPRADAAPSPSAIAVAQADPTGRPPLEIAALRLCSRVKDFGLYEPVDPDALKPGRRIRVYWEMVGLDYEARGDAFVSRMAAHIELRSETDGSVVWEQSPPTAEYTCPRRRRDYYASALLELPRTLLPGCYRLRLIQTDLIGHRAASREIPVTIMR